MADWRHMFEAPHDAAVRLFLPAHKWKADERGRPIPDSVEHGECIGIWDAALEHWIDRASGNKVYPSGWQPLSAA